MKKFHYPISFFLISLSVSIVVGSRGKTRDTDIYYEIFRNISIKDLFSPIEFYQVNGVEIGFGWYSYIISIVNNSSILLFTIWSLLIFFTLKKTIDIIYFQYKNINRISIVLIYLSSGYFVIQQFMQIRQGLAIPLSIYAILVIYSTKKISVKFFILSMISISLHQISLAIIISGIFFYLIIHKFNILHNVSLNKFKFILILSTLLLIFLSKYVLIDLIISVSGRVSDYSDSVFSDSLSIFRLPNIRALFLYFLVVFLLNDRLYQNKIILTLVLFLSIGTAFRFGFIDFSILSGRLSTAFTFVEIFIIPIFFQRFKQCSIILFIYIVVQAVSTYLFQVPSDFYQSYFYELY